MNSLKNPEKGYIKFKCSWEEGEFEFDRKDLEELNYWREKMYAMNLIGAYPDGIGFGNISIRRTALPGFVISGSATGHLPHLGIEHYSYVISYSFKDNSLACIGKVKASSESLSHAAIYETAEKTNAVIHVHSRKYWNAWISREPFTSVDV
ncbi:MAG TPA: class II aldolase/adducin family protein, partial [Cyclobacteriaceae bacterium]|nr:class II aldolase/adducin family protein [Cyclobacteriaceae bacterium]